MLQETQVNGCNAVVWKPDGVTTKLPTLIFFGGIGEDAGHGGMPLLYVNGPAVFLNN
jgi:hypothetical protein